MITEEQAIKIVSDNLNIDINLLEINENPQRKWIIYNEPKEDCWHIYIHSRELCELKSSTIVFVSKNTGEVLYNGSANDEG